MSDENTGALGSAYGGEQGTAPAGRTMAHSLAFGSGSGDMASALSSLIDPERSRQTENKAFWAGMTAPSMGPGFSTGNAMAAEVAARENQDKLRAAYIPMIMQSITQQRANELGYAKFAQERMEKTTPLINSALYGMQANGAPVSLPDAHKRIDDVGSMFGMSPQEMMPHHIALQRGAGPDGAKLPDYLQQLRVAAAPPAEGVTKFNTNAAGQITPTNAVTGAVGSEGQGEHGANPTKTAVEVDKMYRQDPGKFTEDLTGTAQSYNDILQRGNAIQANLDSFKPGRYAQNIGGVAAATKDLAARFPNVATKAINDYVTSLMGTKGDGSDANPQAALQFAESLKTQETLAQLKSSLEGQGRVGQQEFGALNSAMLSSSSDPAAFTKFMDFTRGRAANVTNKLKAWGDYASKSGDKLSVPAFEIPWQVNENTQLIGNSDTGRNPKAGQLDVPPGTQNQAVPNGTIPGISVAPRPTALQQPQPATPQPQAAPAQQMRLEDYEPGTKVGPTGVPYVMDKGVPRRAKRRGVSGPIS